MHKVFQLGERNRMFSVMSPFLAYSLPSFGQYVKQHLMTFLVPCSVFLTREFPTAQHARFVTNRKLRFVTKNLGPR